MPKLSHDLTWMAAANIASSLFNAAIFVYLARVLGPEPFGAFSYAFTIVFFAGNFIDLGLSTYGMREIARNHGRATLFVSEIVTLRLVMAAVLCGALVLAAALSGMAGQLKFLVMLSSLMLFGLAAATEWAFQGLERMRYVFLSFAVTSGLQLGLITAAVRSPGAVGIVPVAYFVAMLPITVLYLRKLHFVFLARRADIARMFAHLANASTLWAISLCAQVYNNLDLVMLGFVRSIEEVGCFAVARRFTGGAAVLLIFLANAVFPRLARGFGSDPGQFRQSTRAFLGLTAAIAALIVVPVIIWSDRLITLLVGPAYISASMPLRVMALGLICVLFNVPHSTGLVAAGFEKDVLKQAAASMGLSIFLNVLLIPGYGMLGSAIAYVAAEALALGWILTVYRKRIRFNEMQK